MNFPWRFKYKSSLGLDIGTSALKVVKLEFVKESVSLSSYKLEIIQNDLVPLLKKIIPPQDIKKINISVSGLSAIIRYIDFPKMTNHELGQALKFEAQKHIPFSPAGVNLDSYILKNDLPNNRMLVLLAAVKKEFISQRIKLLDSVGLKVNIIDMDSVALVNAFNFNYPQEDNSKNKTIALLNIGASFSNLNILENGIPHLSRDIHIAGNNITQKISDIFGIDFKSAEQLKLNPDKERLNKVAAAIESVFSGLASELRTSFDYYESQNASTVVKIFLSGGGSMPTSVKDTLANLLGIEIEQWDPFKNIKYPIDAEQIRAVSAQLAVATGLALRF